MYDKVYWIYQCVNCGKLYYSTKRIKRKKCHSCHSSFKFKDSIKSQVHLTSREVIKLLQYLKEQRFKQKHFDLIEELNKFR
jgi:DNA-directed RNA polymerase subunit RPC12/RpoP